MSGAAAGPRCASRNIDYRWVMAPPRGEAMHELARLPLAWRFAPALARLLRGTDTHILFNEHVAGDGPTVFEHACRLGAEGIVSKRVDGTYQSGPCPA
jgi:ATP-dependent DNA ligase